MTEEKGEMNRDECCDDGIFRIAPPLRGVPVFTFILMLIFSAGTAVLARSGPYGGWLWLVISAGLAAYADFISGSRLPLLAPVLGTVISVVLFYPCVPLWSLTAAFLGYFISAAARGRMARNTSFVLSCVVIIIFAGLHFAALSALAGDFSINGTVAQAVVPYTQMKEIFLENKEILTEIGIEVEPDTFMSAMRDQLLRSLLSAVAVYALIISWLSSVVMNLLSRFFTPDAFICGRKTTMSVTSAIVFIASYLIALLFGSNDSSVIVLASENISAMLMPGFFVVGISEFAAAIKTKVGGMSLGIYIAMVAIALIMSMGGMAVLFAAYGVFYILRTRYLEEIANIGGEQ